MKRYMILITAIYMLGMVVRCTPTPPSERSAVQVTPDSPEVAATLTRIAFDIGLSESLTREVEFAQATYDPAGRATVRARLATIGAGYTPGPTAIPHYGILEHGEDPALLSSFAPGGMLIANGWRGLVDGELLLVFAGTLDPFDTVGQPREVRNIGRLVVHRKRQVYETPEETGALIIVGECHGRLLLTTAGSDTLPPQEMTYDLRTYQMSDSHPTDCAATSTPTPH